jgi:hypothetical protein
MWCLVIVTVFLILFLAFAAWTIWDCRFDDKRTKIILNTLYHCGLCKARDLMDILKAGGIGMSPGRFYMLMSEMEDKGYITHKDVEVSIHGHPCTQRYFDLKTKEFDDGSTEGGSVT